LSAYQWLAGDPLHVVACGWVAAVALGIVFIVLKFIDSISWGWAWVLSPFWIGLIATGVLMAWLALAFFVLIGLKDLWR